MHKSNASVLRNFLSKNKNLSKILNSATNDNIKGVQRRIQNEKNNNNRRIAKQKFVLPKIRYPKTLKRKNQLGSSLRESNEESNKMIERYSKYVKNLKNVQNYYLSELNTLNTRHINKLLASYKANIKKLKTENIENIESSINAANGRIKQYHSIHVPQYYQ